MILTVVGSGTVAPNRDRTAPAHWVEAGAVRLLMDCGAGVLHRAASFDVPWHSVTHLALTHFHPDHWGELPMLLFALRWGVEPRRTAPLTILGPVGLRARLEAAANAFGAWVLEPEYPLAVEEVAPGTTVALDAATELETCKTPHTDESMALGLRHAGAHLVYTGDTGESEALARWADGCDLLLAECSLPDHRAVPLHLTPARAGELAAACNAKRLVLTHFYPVFDEVDPVAVAARAFEGEITAARDGDRFTVTAGT